MGTALFLTPGEVGGYGPSSSCFLLSPGLPPLHSPLISERGEGYPNSKEPTPAHRPVLLQEYLSLLRPQPDCLYVDGTVGEGGHAEALAKLLSSKGHLVLIDRDPEILKLSKKRLKPYPCHQHFFQGSFAQIQDFLNKKHLDRPHGILLDLGLSSFHLKAQRGFSFREDDPLDMRFDPSLPLTAEKVIQTFSEKRLADIFFTLGEEHRSRTFARRIVRAREKQKITTSRQLAQLLIRGQKKRALHPATKVFMSLRIFVNGELQEIEKGLSACYDSLAAGGVLSVMSYHSLEDRLVKRAFRQFAADNKTLLLTPKPIMPERSERKSNRRSRSAKLRAIQKEGRNL